MKSLKKTLVSATAAGALAVPALAGAQGAPASPHTFTGNVGLFSQYIFRGLTQTDGKPAVQGGLDYSHASGFYAGLWASNISWITDSILPNGSFSVEIDTYLGFKLPVGDFTFDVGFLRYNYPGTLGQSLAGTGLARPDTNEVYLGVSWNWLSFKYSYSLGDTFGVADSRGSDYLDLTATVPVLDTGFNLVAHVGKQTFRGTNAALWPAASACTNRCLNYTDWRIGLTKELFGLNWSLMYTTTDTDARARDGTLVWENKFGRNIGRSTVTLGVQKTF